MGTIFIATDWNRGSVSNHFQALATALTERGHRVVVLVPQFRAELADPEANPAIVVWPSKRPTRPRDARFYRQITKQYRPQLTIANFGAVNIMLLMGSLQGVPHRVVWVHTLFEQLAADRDVSMLVWWLLHLRKRFVFQFATEFVANSEATREDLRIRYGIPQDKVRVFYFTMPDVMTTHNIQQGNRAGIVCVARLHQSKGHTVLIEAVAQLKLDFPDLRVTLIGDGELRADLERKVASMGLAETCHFLGTQPYGDVLQHMANAAVHVLPSLAEAFGLVNVEAMAVGTPVVSSAVGGIPDVVRDGVDGHLVPPGDVDALAMRLRQVLGDEAHRTTLGQNARARFLETFEREQALSQQIAWIEDRLSS